VGAKRKTSAAIRHALFVARDAATPGAAKEARANVQLAARERGSRWASGSRSSSS